jgi:hypothetical protein
VALTLQQQSVDSRLQYVVCRKNYHGKIEFIAPIIEKKKMALMFAEGTVSAKVIKVIIVTLE